MSGKQNNPFQNAWAELTARWILGVTFLLACGHKIVNPAQFAKIIYGYYLFPGSTINVIAILVPFLELFCGLALIFGLFPRSAALILNGLLLAFIIAMSINLIRGHEFDCGCFSFGGSDQAFSVVQLLVRDIVCFFLGLYVLLFDKRRKCCLKQTGSLLENMGRDACTRTTANKT